MSMLVFYINRAGRTLSSEQRRRLERAKLELRTLYGKSGGTPVPRGKRVRRRTASSRRRP
jgi:hypothetical protein